MLRFHTLSLLLVILCLGLSTQFAAAQTATLTVHADTQGKPISADLFGIFFEDLNHAADGGPYAELVQNRSFEYSSADNKNFAPLTARELVQHGGGQGSVTVEPVSRLDEIIFIAPCSGPRRQGKEVWDDTAVLRGHCRAKYPRRAAAPYC